MDQIYYENDKQKISNLIRKFKNMNTKEEKKIHSINTGTYGVMYKK